MAFVDELPPVVQGSSDEARAWLRQKWLTLAAVALIALSLWLKAQLLASTFFREDDFILQESAHSTRLGWQFLMTMRSGHLIPGGVALAWLEARFSYFDWTFASTITLALLLAGSLAMLRLLRTLFGPRPAILALLALFLFSPLSMPGLTWWTASLAWVPLELALCLALDAHIRYVRGRGSRYVGWAASWMAVGMCFSAQGVLIPLLVFGLTSAFLVGRGSWLRAVTVTVRRYWRAWLIYAIVASAYLALFASALPQSTILAGGPGTWSNVLIFGSTLLRVTFAPGALGTIWGWWSLGGYALVSRIPGLTEGCWMAGVIIVALSLWYRRHAWRAWLILASWLILADITLEVIALPKVINPALLGLDTHYLADSTAVLAICVGLAFLPVDGEADAYRAQRPSVSARLLASIAACGLVLASSVWSLYTYETRTSGHPARSYIATARQALTLAPVGTVIVSAPAPASVANPELFGAAAYTERVLGPLAPAGAAVHWTSAPRGVIRNLMIFDRRGRLRQAGMQGVNEAFGTQACDPVGRAVTRVWLQYPLYRWSWTLRFGYSGPAAAIDIGYGNRWQTLFMPAGVHAAYLQVSGSGNNVRFRILTPGIDGCVGGIIVGLPSPSSQGTPIPPAVVPG